MTDCWTSSLPWADHERALGLWAAQRWGWTEGDPDWPSCLALLVAAQDEGHTALAWESATRRLARRFEALAPEDLPALPDPTTWPQELFDQGWLRRTPRGPWTLIQSARQAELESRLYRALRVRTTAGPSGRNQDDAVARAGRPLVLLTGGPGTGKTTTLKRMVAAWSLEKPGLRAVVAAPTGRAAARARESFAGGNLVPECVTLHRLLGLRPGLGEAWHGPHRPLPFDLVIVDEASMLDLRTAVTLVEALAPETALVLVGDPGQLPSVEAGSVLADLLAHSDFEGSTVRLTQRFRLDEASAALAEVFDLLQGGHALSPEQVADRLALLGGGTRSDFQWIETPEGGDPGPAALVAWGSPRSLTLADLSSRVLLSPVHRGLGGAETLGALAERQLGRAPGTPADGTPWMIRKNLPHLQLHNGDRGLVVRRDGRLWFLCPDETERRLPFSLVAEDGVAAWAITVHKSQGSEFDRVVLVVPPQPGPGLVRELLYTGLTRAKTSAVLVSSRKALVVALSRTLERVSGFGL